MPDSTVADLTPVAALTGSAKIYVDQDGDHRCSADQVKAFVAVPLPSSAVPGMDGIPTAGTATTYARGDHVHPTDTSREAAVVAGAVTQYWRGDKSWQNHDKASVGLANVDNTTDAAKPVSVATQTALDAKQALAEKGVANGYAPLDASSKVPAANLPDAAGADVDKAYVDAQNAAQDAVIATKLGDAAADSQIYGRSNNAWVEIPEGTGADVDKAYVDAANAAQDITIAAKLDKSGGTVTGFTQFNAHVQLNMTPTSQGHAANKKYVDDTAATMATIAYVDNENAAQDAVIATKLGDAAADSQIYGRSNNAWVEIPESTGGDVTKAYVDSENAAQDTEIADKLSTSAGGYIYGAVRFQAKVEAALDPVAGTDIANKAYVDYANYLQDGTIAAKADITYVDAANAAQDAVIAAIPSWVEMTQAEYDALVTKDPNTLYVIVG